MKISGFTFIRNGAKLYYPVQESIRSVLDIVDEFVIALGDNDKDDQTRALIEQINSEKIRIIDTVWDLDKYPNGTEHAHQTDIAKNACQGDWLLYLQADEVIHENDLESIRSSCEEYLDSDIDGFVFDYLHFWGDYKHYQLSHGWYKNEIRIVRNKPEIHSFTSAQSFRKIPDFDGLSYREKKGTTKLLCKKLSAKIYHYGWVRPPELMNLKKKYIDTNHHGKSVVETKSAEYSGLFDYGDMRLLPEYMGTHPSVMVERIADCFWSKGLAYEKKENTGRKKHKHERFKYKLITFFEQKMFRGRPLFESRNYRLI